MTSLVDQELLAQRAIAIGIDIDDDGLTSYITSEENPDFPLFSTTRSNLTHKYLETHFGTVSASLQAIIGLVSGASCWQTDTDGFLKRRYSVRC